MKSLKLLIGDPGKTNDPFGIFGLQGTWPERKIYPRYAEQLWHKPYSTVAKRFEFLQKKIKPDMTLIEKNFDHDRVSKAFSHLPITYVTMSNNLKEETRAKGWSVDKPYMMGWLKDEDAKHSIQYSLNPSKDMEEFVNQRNQIVGITAPSGHVSYKAQRNRHDDLFMCHVIGCNAIRLWWDQQ